MRVDGRTAHVAALEQGEIVDLADVLRRLGDRRPIRNVKLKRDRARPNFLDRRLATLEIARPGQHSEAVRHKFLCDLKSDSLIGPGHQGDAPVLHGYSSSSG